MDVLRPTLVRIGGRVYRKNVIHEQVQQQEEEDFYTGVVQWHGTELTLGVASCVCVHEGLSVWWNEL